MVASTSSLTQSWYGALENMRFSLPDEDAKEKAAGEAWPIRIERFKEAALSVSLLLKIRLMLTVCSSMLFAGASAAYDVPL